MRMTWMPMVLPDAWLRIEWNYIRPGILMGSPLSMAAR